MNDHREHDYLARDLIVAVAAALFVRVTFLLLVPRVIDMADAIHYINMARQFAAGDFVNFDENLPVLYSALGAIAHLVFEDWEHAFWSVSLLSSVLLVVPVYLLVRELHGASTARVSVFLVCLWPWLVDYAGRIVPDSLAVFLWFMSLWLVYTAIQRGGWALWLAPITLFALHLARPEGTFLMIGAPVLALVLRPREGGRPYRRVAAIAISSVVLLLCYAVAMRYSTGTASVSYRAPMAGDIYDYFRRGGIDGARTFLRLVFDVLPVMLNPIMLIFLGAGIFLPSERPANPRLGIFILLFCTLQLALAVANFSPAPRYVMTIVVALSFWSAHGLVLVSGQAARNKKRPWLRFAPVVFMGTLFVVGLAGSVIPERFGRVPALPREYKLAGQWMKEHVEPGIIICRKPQVGFYADMPTTGPAFTDSPADVIARAMEIGARYLVFDERYSAAMIPGLEVLLDPREAPPELKLLNADLSPWARARIVVYEFVAPGIEYADPRTFGGSSSHMGPDDQRRKNATEPE